MSGLHPLEIAPPIGVRGVRQGGSVSVTFTGDAPRALTGAQMTLFSATPAEIARTLADELGRMGEELKATRARAGAVSVGVAPTGGPILAFLSGGGVAVDDLNQAFRSAE